MIDQQPTFLSYPGEMAGIMRDKDWSASLVGTPDTWPITLQTILGVILHSRFPMFVWWGPELVCFYNDAYRPSLGREGKHPSILGMPAAEAWPEIWDIISPLIQQVLDGGEAIWMEDQLVPIFRNGHIEDVYWTFSYSRINNDDGYPYGVLVTCVETTEKLVSRRQLQESKNLLQFATEAADLGTWDYNPITGKFIANERLKSWFGLGAEDETDLQLAIDSIAEKDRQQVVDSMARSLDYAIQAPYEIEYCIVHPRTLEETVVLVKGRPFFDPSGIAYRFSGTMEDITQKNKIRQALAESEKNLRNLVEQAPVAMCVLKGPEHIVDIVNEKMIGLWGKNRSEIMFKPIFQGLPEAAGQGLEELLKKVYTTGERFVAQERPVDLPRANGIETVYQNFVYEPLRGNPGTIEGVIAVTIDVTEQVTSRRQVEEAEERARLAVEAGNLGTFDLDIGRDIAILSPRLLEIFDVTADADHTTLMATLHPEDLVIRNRAHEQALLTGQMFYEVRVIRKDQRISWVRVEGKVLRDKEGKATRIVGTALDFTDKRELDQKREEYIAIASHELRNPLTSLKLVLDLLSELLKEKDQLRLLEKSKEQVGRLITMTGELLNVSKISQGVLDLKPEIINLKQSITDSITTAQAGTGLNSFVLTGSPDINIKADKFRLEQVLVNLLNNASKYSPRGSEIVIDVSSIPDFVKVTVIDKGIGIEAAKKDLIFKKFVRVDSDTHVEGHGLGLYISDQIIHNHGGQMGVESEKGIGSQFWFTLPH